MKHAQRKRTLHRCSCSGCQAHPSSELAAEHRAINRVLVTLDEKERRRFVGLLALKQTHGGIAHLITITGLSRNTIAKGRQEVGRLETKALRGRTRRAGSGRKAVEKNSRTW